MILLPCFFTYHFIKEGLIKKPVKDWNAIFSNAKDKTSQMFMRLPIEDRSKLAKEGVINQTAKAFSMPTLSNKTDVIAKLIKSRVKLRYTILQNNPLISILIIMILPRNGSHQKHSKKESVQVKN